MFLSNLIETLGGSPLFSALQYVKYLRKAVGPHSIHSPFVFDLYNQAIKPSSRLRVSEIEKKRKSLSRNHQLIDVIDFKTNRTQRKTVSAVAKSSLSFPKFSAFLHLLSVYLKTKSILETGTCLGINTLYLGSTKDIKVATVEGSAILQQLAEDNFAQLSYENITVEPGDVNKVLSTNLIKHKPDLIFLDADHRGKSILKQVEEIMKTSPSTECIVIHDINWSRDMNIAWQQLVSDERFAISIDIFQAGLLFPKRSIEKQHFTLRF